MTETCSKTVSGRVFETLYYKVTLVGCVYSALIATCLEYNMLFEDVLDTGDLVLGFAFRKLCRFRSTVEHRSI